MAFSDCPKCPGRIKVVDSRGVEDYVKRRYRCVDCATLFYSEERMVGGPAKRVALPQTRRKHRL